MHARTQQKGTRTLGEIWTSLSQLWWYYCTHTCTHTRTYTHTHTHTQEKGTRALGEIWKSLIQLWWCYQSISAHPHSSSPHSWPGSSALTCEIMWESRTPGKGSFKKGTQWQSCLWEHFVLMQIICTYISKTKKSPGAGCVQRRACQKMAAHLHAAISRGDSVCLWSGDALVSIVFLVRTSVCLFSGKRPVTSVQEEQDQRDQILSQSRSYMAAQLDI